MVTRSLTGRLSKEPSEVDDQFQISFMIGRGWSYITIVQEHEFHKLDISESFSDPISAVIQLCYATLEGLSVLIPFYGEPGGWAWRLAPVQAKQHLILIEIFQIADAEVGNFDEKYCKDAIIRFKTKRTFLLTILLAELWKNALLFREPSFQKNRTRFPFEDLVRLTVRWRSSSFGVSEFFRRSPPA